MYKKINIFVRHMHQGKSYFAYACSTNMSKTCKAAKQRYYEIKYPAIAIDDIKCRFA